MLPRQLQRVPGWTEQLWDDRCDVRQQRTGAVAKSPRCHRVPTSIRQAVPSVCREGPSLAGLSRIGLTIDLIPGRAQTGNAIPVQVALPRQELLDRELVGLADRIERHPAAADGLDNRRLTSDGPPPVRWCRLG